MERDDLIFALATPPGRSAIAVLRLSGKDADRVIGEIFCSRSELAGVDLPVRKMLVGLLRKSDSEIVDEILLCRFKAPHSYTGEDLYEIHTHGNPLIVREIYGLLQAHGARVAEPGEFSKRAYLNGKMDLVQIEAVAEMIEARSNATLKALRAQYDGTFSIQVAALRQKILEALAWIEADIDFGDREVDDVVPVEALNLETSLQEVEKAVSDLIQRTRANAGLRNGFEAVLIGRPNVGKSSIFNYLCGDARALVNELPGTTRDYLEASLEFDGLPCRLIDTAGLRAYAAVNESLEREGIKRTESWMKRAAFILAVFDQSEALTSEDEVVFSSLRDSKQLVLVVVNKMDLPRGRSSEGLANEVEGLKTALKERFLGVVSISAEKGSGMSEIVDELKIAAKLIFEKNESLYAEDSYYLSARQLELLSAIEREINKALTTLKSNLGFECITAHLRSVTNAFSRLLGRDLPAAEGLHETEEILGQIFSSFCIGK